MIETAEIAPETQSFYAHSLETLTKSGVPFMLAGAYALCHYTGVVRHTKDLDVFCTAGDYPRLLEALTEAGYQTEITNPTWIAKAFQGEDFVDLIFNSSNQMVPVDESWFQHAPEEQIFGQRVKLIPAEEMIWSKTFVQKRYRSDEADVLHLILKQGDRLDWKRLLTRMEPIWELLLARLLSFWYVYPSERHMVPVWVMEQLLQNASAELTAPPAQEKITRGRLLSKEDYRVDLDWGFSEH